MFDIFSNAFDLDTEYVNRTYSDLEEEMGYVGMRKEADEILESVQDKLENDNPFDVIASDHVDISPTSKIIRFLYECAEDAVKVKYPTAVVTYVASDYRASFSIKVDEKELAEDE